MATDIGSDSRRCGGDGGRAPGRFTSVGSSDSSSSISSSPSESNSELSAKIAGFCCQFDFLLQTTDHKLQTQNFFIFRHGVLVSQLFSYGKDHDFDDLPNFGMVLDPPTAGPFRNNESKGAEIGSGAFEVVLYEIVDEWS